jgi:hypothetical protein
MKKIIISLILALVFFVFGYFIRGLTIGNNSYQAGWDAAKQRLADSGLSSPVGNFEIKNVSGQVTAVQGNTITLKIRPLEPLADANLDERIVTIDANTKIYLLEQKDPTQYQKEMTEFNKKTQEQLKTPSVPGQTPASPTSAVVPPEFFVKKLASISDIKIGTMINVVAVDKDIKNTKQFIAAEIYIQQAPIIIPSATIKN